MNLFSADLLEFEAIKALVARYVSSPAGHNELDRVEPHSRRGVLEASLAETAEAIDYLNAAAQPQGTTRGAAVRFRFDSLPDVSGHLAKLGIGGVVLEGMEIRDLTTLLDRACDIRAILTATRYPRLSGRAARIGDFRSLLRDLSGKIEADGSVSDHASVALHRIRRDMEKQQRLIQDSLEKFLRQHRDDGVMQEDFVAIRNERFVLPVVAGQKKKIGGIIHGASGTGHTLFIEPLETVELNNDLVRLRDQEQREIVRILEEITGRLREVVDDIRVTVQVLGELELFFAKARFADDFSCAIPTFSAVGAPRLSVLNARHPLLIDVLQRHRKKVVPLTLTLEASTRTLLISGPNTGGKTVALKTIGTLVLMAQSGLPVPAEAAELPVFERVLADIGDHQSLEQSLSSFSSHITRVREMMDALDENSLVLFDELGRATDPDEGGALGVAILDNVRRTGAFTLASTHLLAPKIYGSTTEGVVNASMSFDEQTLAPTYHLRVGSPGASAGLDIAQRLGLPHFLIEQARASMSTTQQDLARFLKLLEERLENVTRLEVRLTEQKRALDIEQAELKHTWEKRETAKLKELERRTDQLIDQFQRRANDTIDRIEQTSDQRKFATQASLKVAQAKREIREELEVSVRGAKLDPETPKLVVAEGARVRLRGVREIGRVKRLLKDGGIEVEVGFLKLQVGSEEVLEILPETHEAAKLPKGVSVSMGPRFETTFRELNLIGRRADEAVEEADKFLDNAALASIDRVRIVHGHGMGILKKAIAELLNKHPHVAKFYPATPQEGGTGATVVELSAE